MAPNWVCWCRYQIFSGCQIGSEPTMQTSTRKVLFQRESLFETKRAPSKTWRCTSNKSRLDPGNKAECGRWGWKGKQKAIRETKVQTLASLTENKHRSSAHWAFKQRPDGEWEDDPEINTAAPDKLTSSRCERRRRGWWNLPATPSLHLHANVLTLM